MKKTYTKKELLEIAKNDLDLACCIVSNSNGFTYVYSEEELIGKIKNELDKDEPNFEIISTISNGLKNKSKNGYYSYDYWEYYDDEPEPIDTYERFELELMGLSENERFELP